MNRRLFVLTLGGIVLSPLVLSRVLGSSGEQARRGPMIVRSEEEWRRLLTPEQLSRPEETYPLDFAFCPACTVSPDSTRILTTAPGIGQSRNLERSAGTFTGIRAASSVAFLVRTMAVASTPAWDRR